MLREQFRNEIQEILSPNGAKSQLPAKKGSLRKKERQREGEASGLQAQLGKARDLP